MNKLIFKCQFMLLCFLFILFVGTTGWTATYYVDATNGQDSNNGLAITAPWKTIAKVNAITFQPGDQILFSRGEVWREALIPSSSGSLGNPITFGAYGSGNKPVFKASDLIQTWSTVAGGHNSRMATVAIRPYVVWENNVALTARGSLVEVEANVGSFYWNSGALYVSATSGYPDTNGKIYEVAQRTDSCRIENKNYITIHNVAFVQSGNNGGVGLRIVNASNNILVDACDFSQATNQHLAIWANLPTNGNYKISRCTFDYSGLQHIGGSGSAIDVLSTNSNDITLIGEYNTFAHVGNNMAAPYLDHGIYFKSGRLVWRYNYHYNGGPYTGACVKISGTAKDDCEIYYNIFSSGGGTQNWGILSEAGSGHVIYNNVFYNIGTGVWQSGTNGPAVTGGSGMSLKNNIFHTTTSLFIRATIITNVISDNNAFFNGATKSFLWGSINCSYSDWRKYSGQDANSIYADPQFVQPTADNFRLRATSPCIKAGVNVGLTQDFSMNPLAADGNVDIGAFVYK